MWVEISVVFSFDKSISVTPLAGVWVEIRGNKGNRKALKRVTPLAGVWVEIQEKIQSANRKNVTPLAGVWVEIARWVSFNAP